MVQIRPQAAMAGGLDHHWLGVLGIGLKRVKDPQAGWWARTDLAMGLGDAAWRRCPSLLRHGRRSGTATTCLRWVLSCWSAGWPA